MAFLVKIQDSNYIHDMYEKEYLYFSVFRGFRNFSKDEAGRFDPREGNLKNVQLTSLTCEVDGKKFDFTKNAISFIAQYMEHLAESNMNICSFFIMKFEPDWTLIPFDQRIERFGDKALIFTDPERLFEILERELAARNLRFSRHHVEYYDPFTYDGDLELHSKDEAYSYQQEYRILIGPAGKNGLKIPIPGLRKIAHVLETKKLKHLKVNKIDTVPNSG